MKQEAEILNDFDKEFPPTANLEQPIGIRFRIKQFLSTAMREQREDFIKILEGIQDYHNEDKEFVDNIDLEIDKLRGNNAMTYSWNI